MGSSAYNQIPYPLKPYPQTHPARLAAHAVLLGLDPPPVDAARVLEIGCGAGANLLPMAAALPGSRFTGIDIADVPVAAGRLAIESLGLTNIALRTQSLGDLPAEPFDYVIAHGIYSWVAFEVREDLFAKIASVLSPHGVAFVSYNCYPGAYARQALREACLLHAGAIEDPLARAAEAQSLLALLASQPEAAWLSGECKRMAGRAPAEFIHDDLSEHSAAVYFFQFAQHARAHGLQFLAEASFGGSSLYGLPPEVASRLESLAADNPLASEQYIDLFRMRGFRQTLLVRGDVFIDRGAVGGGFVSLETRTRATRLGSLWASSSARAVDREAHEPEGSAAYTLADGSRMATANGALRSILDRLAEAWPRPVAAREFNADASSLIELHNAGFADLQAWIPPEPSAGSRPATPRIARWQATNGRAVTNRYHQAVQIEDSFTRSLLALLDGTRDPDALGRILGRPVDHELQELSRCALLGIAD